MMPVSVVVNTLNEEANLPGCLESVRWSDDIVVVDMHSDDRTAAIAASAGCRVFPYERTGYVEPARNFALSQARHPWVLVLDADERVSPGLAQWIQNSLPATTSAAFLIPRRNLYGKRWLTCCGWFPDKQLRLFRRARVSYSDRIHRAPSVDGAVATLPLKGEAYLEHHVFNTLESRMDKNIKYSTIAAEAMAKENRHIGAFGLLGRTIFSFISAYFFQGGFRQGSLGMVMAWERAFATYLKYAKLWELRQGAK